MEISFNKILATQEWLIQSGSLTCNEFKTLFFCCLDFNHFISTLTAQTDAIPNNFIISMNDVAPY